MQQQQVTNVDCNTTDLQCAGEHAPDSLTASIRLRLPERQTCDYTQMDAWNTKGHLSYAVGGHSL